MIQYMKKMPNTIKQILHFKAKPKALYEAFLNSKKHTFFTGAKAVISPKVGAKFSAWDGYCNGKNLKLVKNELIVQSWRATDWPEKQYSTAMFEFIPEKRGTKLIFTQTDVPKSALKDISKGWKEYYWKPLKKFLE